MTRRHLLAGMGASALLPAPSLASATEQAQGMLALLSDREAAARLGAVWNAQESRRPEVVLQDLQERLRGADSARLRDAIADDFRTGAVVKIEGWQIARTQAELCALAYFVKTGRL